MQFLSKWSDSPHLQHLSEHVETVVCQMGFNDLATQGLAADRIKIF